MNKVLILDFGSQYTFLIAKKVRELKIYCEIKSYDTSIQEIKNFNAQAIIFSGGPASVHKEGAYKVDSEVFTLNIPILGICYGMQYLCQFYGSKVITGHKQEFGQHVIEKIADSKLIENVNFYKPFLMSHTDKVDVLSDQFKLIAKSGNNIAIVEHVNKFFYGVQCHIEVAHSPEGKKILKNFLIKICKIKPSWNIKNIEHEKIENIKKTLDKDNVILGLSGGVDSTICAVLISKACAKNLKCIFVNTGLLRTIDLENINYLKNHFPELEIDIVEASEKFYEALKGVIDPEQKRKIIGKLFIDVFEEEAKKFNNVKYLAQGTIYSDVIESSKNSSTSVTIKSHHNVGGLPEKLNFKLIEPLRDLLKDETRKLGKDLGISEKFINRHPFPGPGLAVRIIGEVTKEKVMALQKADNILQEEFSKANLFEKTSQAFVVFTNTQTVGVMGDFRTYKNLAVIRCINTVDFMTAEVSELPWNVLKKIATRIINEVPLINRVSYDITSKPPATIEWE